MTVSQQINHINDQNYDDDITVTGVPKGYFVAVTANSFGGGSNTREVKVELLPLGHAPGGTGYSNTGLFMRQSGENAICAKVYNGGTLECENTINYS